MIAKTALLVLVASLAYAAANGTEADKKAQLDLIFNAIDENDDGKISLEEAKAFYSELGLNDASIEKAFKKADTNGDGFVCKKEFKVYAKDISAPSKEDRLADLFDSIDKDNDNYITLDEAKKFYTFYGIPVEDIEASFKLADKDEDGKLSEEEFLEYAKNPTK